MSSNFLTLKKGVRVGLSSSEPVDGQNGDIYYNTTLNKFRKYENGLWSDLDTTAPPSSLNMVEFDSSTDWPVPLGIEQAIIIGVGGGQGGGGGAGSNPFDGSTRGTGGGGGRGAIPKIVQTTLDDSDTLRIAIGAGGSGGSGRTSTASGGDGAAGGNTTIIGLVNNGLDGSYNEINTQSPNRKGVNLFFAGAAGSGNGGILSTSGSSSPANTSVSTVPSDYEVSSSSISGGTGTLSTSSSAGKHSSHARGGNRGARGRDSGSRNGSGGGGGGGAGLNAGGHGGMGGGGATGSETAAYSIASASRSSNIVTLTMNTSGSYNTRNFNVGELIRVEDLDASFNNISGSPFVITAVPSATTIQYEQAGIDEVSTATPGKIFPARNLIDTSGTKLQSGKGVDGSRGSGGGGGGGAGGAGSVFLRSGFGGDGGDGCVIIIY